MSLRKECIFEKRLLNTPSRTSSVPKRLSDVSSLPISFRRNSSKRGYCQMSDVVSATGTASETEINHKLIARWRKEEIPLRFTSLEWETFTVQDLKFKIDTEMDIPWDRIKLTGITNLGQSDNKKFLQDLQFKKRGHFMLIGTKREKQLSEVSEAEGREVVNDLNWVYVPTAIQANPVHQDKLRQAIQNVKILTLHPPRPNMKLLVLDVTNTLVDIKVAPGYRKQYMRRPYATELLEKVYPYYDICLWTEISWKNLKKQMQGIELLESPKYEISMYIDSKPMFTVTALDKRGKKKDHYVKALEIIWQNCQGAYTPENTIHVDDLSRYFSMNPKNGIKIEPYESSKNPHEDMELAYMAEYLVSIASSDDLTRHHHAKWKQKTSHAML